MGNVPNLQVLLTFTVSMPPFVRITGIRFYGYNLSPCFFHLR